jgi:hypothetical protein
MRIFLVVALVLAGAIGVAQVFQDDPSEADATPATIAAEAAPTTLELATLDTATLDTATLVPATFDATTTTAVAAGTTPTTSSVVVDSTVPVSTLSPILSSFCPTGLHAAVVDRDRQMAWLCEMGVAMYEFPFTGAITQPDPGTYPVYAKDLNASSSSSAGVSRMTHFVAFTYGKFRGARIAFHSVPTWSNGEWLQPLESVGDVARRGESAGCLRVLPDDAVRVWEWLSKGDEVRVIS